jgi:(p)ppGpp synthase/HD superfamily hydrolase
MATIEDAIQIAAQVHQGQKDKAGKPYILHPLRLMMRVQSETEMMVAVLHDVVEDSRDKPRQEDRWTIERLRDYGFSEEVLEALQGVTNKPGESYEEFIERAATNPVARRVKIADLEDNMNILRIGEIKQKDLERLEKYHRSWRALTDLVKS